MAALIVLLFRVIAIFFVMRIVWSYLTNKNTAPGDAKIKTRNTNNRFESTTETIEDADFEELS